MRECGAWGEKEGRAEKAGECRLARISAWQRRCEVVEDGDVDGGWLHAAPKGREGMHKEAGAGEARLQHGPLPLLTAASSRGVVQIAGDTINTSANNSAILLLMHALALRCPSPVHIIIMYCLSAV